MPECNYCHADFADYKELALHIVFKKHRAGLKWAANYLTKVNILNKIKDKPDRIPLTEQELENKENAHRELSGENRTVLTTCPKCNQSIRMYIPIEHAENCFAWRKGRAFMILCDKCRGTREFNN